MTVAFDDIHGDVERYYSGKLRKYGPTPEGVDWNSAESQEIRFRELLRAAPDRDTFSLNDYGCGYGALAARVSNRVDYVGFDLSEAMVARARELHPSRRFITEEAELRPAEITLASGIFNVKLGTSDERWGDYVDATVDRLAELSTRAFAFNMLTGYSDPDRMRPDLHYADPCRWFDRCKRRYSRHVALLHDYGLWEFTMIVRCS